MKRWFRKLVLIILLIPTTLFVIWWLTPKQPLRVFVVDKTVLDKRCQEHRSFFWLLTHWKYAKEDKKLYRTRDDYFGFFPMIDPKTRERKYLIHDLQKYDGAEIDSLSRHYDMAYVTDSYGVYKQEWDNRVVLGDFSDKIYGGLDSCEARFLKRMKEQRKLVILEYNSINSPTPEYVRRQVEDTFGFRWTGWSGRYFDSLDSLVNIELPKWVIRRYEAQYNRKWHFRNPGQVFVHLSGEIVVLETPTDLTDPLPLMKIDNPYREYYKLPEQLTYPYWFDITLPQGDSLEVMAKYQLHTTVAGDTTLAHHGIPRVFPAMMRHKDRFFYLSGDFSDNRITTWPAYFKWSEYIAYVGKYMPESAINRSRFFWDFYLPLVKRVMHDYQISR